MVNTGRFVIRLPNKFCIIIVGLNKSFAFLIEKNIPRPQTKHIIYLFLHKTYELTFFFFFSLVSVYLTRSVAITYSSDLSTISFSSSSIAMSMRGSSAKKIKIRGFMCHSGGNAVCMVNDPRSVLMPRRTPSKRFVDHAMLMNTTHNNNNNNNNNSSSAAHANNKYSRLLDSHHQRLIASSSAANRRKLAAAIKKDQDPSRQPKPKPIIPSSTPPLAQTQITTDQAFQVVVMKVAIHCQGCAGKVKKHLSKMEGVTSFSIDVESRRVTVMGHVSPLLVVESVSKVKRAELWADI